MNLITIRKLYQEKIMGKIEKPDIRKDGAIELDGFYRGENDNL
ncbi:MAG: hypothetical protein RBR58_01040 [Candidatus Humimicrobiaceae bacterium]|jgi:hypothetical protein|nr:hypothetical protein [Candidatus Humimicrobiaceae bacterium]